MKNEIKAELVSFLKNLPPVEFCCVYGSALHPNNHDKSKMIDYVLGVSDPEQWHAENLKMNADHYAKRMGLMGGAKLITLVADKIGVGVHFNPFVEWNDKRFKYGVVRMHDLVQDILNWERFYLSGRLQKPVHILVDNLDIENVNCVNLRAAMSAALVLLPPKFTEEDLYVKICSLSYMGDLRMLFAEDRNKWKEYWAQNCELLFMDISGTSVCHKNESEKGKLILKVLLFMHTICPQVKKIVQGQFDLFQSRYKPFLEEYEAKELLRFSSSANPQTNISQECGLPVTRSLVSSLPPMVKSQIGMKLGVKNIQSESGRVINEVMTGSREEVARCMEKVLRRTVMVSSARQAASGLLTVGGVNAARYLASKMQKAWRSWT